MITHVPPAISFRNVEVRYTDLVWGLQAIDLEIAKGEFVFLVGATGAGKSTVLKVISREATHTGGKALLYGKDLAAIRPHEIAELRRGMGIIPQDFGLLPNKRVWENVGYAMRAVGATKAEVRKAIPELLEKVNIGHRVDAFPHELSGGEQQRVAIARALINNPQLLLADEPTGNLDVEHSLEIVELLLQLNLRGATVLVASHDTAIVQRCQKRVVTLSHGRIVSDARTTLNFEEPLHASDPKEGTRAVTEADWKGQSTEGAEPTDVLGGDAEFEVAHTPTAAREGPDDAR